LHPAAHLSLFFTKKGLLPQEGFFSSLNGVFDLEFAFKNVKCKA